MADWVMAETDRDLDDGPLRIVELWTFANSFASGVISPLLPSCSCDSYRVKVGEANGAGVYSSSDATPGSSALVRFRVSD